MVPRLFDVQTSSRNERDRFVFQFMDRVYTNRNTITANGDTVVCIDDCPLPRFFLIATNLCEIVKIALILRFVILASIECFNANRLFYRSRKIEFTQNITYYARNRSSRLTYSLSFSLSDYI